MKCIVITGPTASGKTSLSISLAKKFNGEIISADSRQVYQGMDIGSAKVTKKEMSGISHHLLNVANPATEKFSLADFTRLARKEINEINKRGNIPFVVGGTGLYLTALIEDYKIPNVAPNKELRKELQEKSLKNLQNIYKKLDPAGFEKIDINNPIRLIRAIEVVKVTSKPFFSQQKKGVNENHYLNLGIEVPFSTLKQRIHQRINDRFPSMFEETKKLHKQGVSWQRLESFGLEYKWMARLAQNKVSKKSSLENLEKETIKFAKRQLTWWKKRKIIWIKNEQEAEKSIKVFLKS